VWPPTPGQYKVRRRAALSGMPSEDDDDLRDLWPLRQLRNLEGHQRAMVRGL
jgi:hypothetical protein